MGLRCRPARSPRPSPTCSPTRPVPAPPSSTGPPRGTARSSGSSSSTAPGGTADRRRHLVETVKRYADRQRILILEDAAYRELRYEGDEIASVKSFDPENRFVVYAGTFSKPCAPGLKTGYALMPTELVEPLVRMKGNHDFGSNNLSQHIIYRLLTSGAYAKHVEYLRGVY